MPLISQRKIALLKILFTTMLWGSTYVLVRMGLDDLGPLMLAGVRYTLAGFVLLPVLKFQNISIWKYRSKFGQLALLGILSFTIGNGSSGFALEYLPSTTVSFITSLTTPLVLLFGIFLLDEIPNKIQVSGVALTLIGLFIYFPLQDFDMTNPGYAILIVSMLGFTFYTVLGRFVARSRETPFLVQTTVPFLIGGGLLLILALIYEGIPVLTLKSGLIIMWMVIMNSIIGYLLYNQALMELSALEVNVVMKLSPFFNALFAWILLGERITPLQLLAMGIVFLGVYLVQQAKHKKPVENI